MAKALVLLSMMESDSKLKAKLDEKMKGHPENADNISYHITPGGGGGVTALFRRQGGFSRPF